MALHTARTMTGNEIGRDSVRLESRPIWWRLRRSAPYRC